MNVHVINEGAPLETSVEWLEHTRREPHSSGSTTFWIMDPARKLYKDLHWFHKGGNVLGVSGRNVSKVKTFIEANEEAYWDIPWLMWGGNNAQPELFVAFRNKHQFKNPHRRVDELFDRLIAHFSDDWFKHDGFTFDDIERYRR